MKKKRKHLKQSRKGASSVEFALVFPLVLTFFLGLITVAQGFLILDMTQLAAYEGARRGTILDATAEEVMARTKETLGALRLRDVDILVSPSQIDNSTPEVEVSINVPMRSNAWAAGPFLPSNWVIGSSVKLRKSGS